MSEKPNNQTVPLSQGQKALSLIQVMNPGSHAYNMNYAWWLKTPLDVERFKRALALLTQRHPALRSTLIRTEDNFAQLAHAEMDVAFHEVDVSHWRDSEVRDKIADEGCKPFNLQEQPPSRWVLFHRGEKEPVLFWGLHHSCADLWSVMTLFNELGAAYTAFGRGEEPQLQPVASTNHQFVDLEDAFIKSEEGDQMLAFWQEQLSGELPVLQFPTDYPRPMQPAYVGESHRFLPPDTLMNDLSSLAKTCGARPFTLFLAAYVVFLHRYTGQNDLCVGAPTAGRKKGGLFHYCVNLVTIRSYPHGHISFRQFLTEMEERVEQVLKNSQLPFPYLVQNLNLEMDPSRAPIFQTSFVWENPNRFENRDKPMVEMGPNGHDLWRPADMKWERIPFRQQQDNFDIILKIVKLQDRYYGLWEYNARLFNAETMTRLTSNFETLLAAILADPDALIGKLNLLSDDERHKVVVAWNDTET